MGYIAITEDSFQLRHDGVYRAALKEDKETRTIKTTWHKVCSPLRVLAHARDCNGENWSIQVEVTDPDGIAHILLMRMSLVSLGRGFGRLAELGLILSIHPRARQWLKEYLITSNPTECILLQTKD